MEYKKDQNKQRYLEAPLGWDTETHKLRITVIEADQHIRFSKQDDKNHIYPGPEVDIRSIPKIIQALSKILDDSLPRS